MTIALQSIFDSTYDRSGYDYSLRYDLPPEPIVAESDVAWLNELLKSSQTK